MPVTSFIVKNFTIKTAKFNLHQEADHSFKALFIGKDTTMNFFSSVIC